MVNGPKLHSNMPSHNHCLIHTVIDVYSAWCGPCKAVLSLLRRIKNELGDDLLRFAIAKSDNINSLEPYREQSEPTFLFFAVSFTYHKGLPE